MYKHVYATNAALITTDSLPHYIFQLPTRVIIGTMASVQLISIDVLHDGNSKS
jgi:hypothetical protein